MSELQICHMKVKQKSMQVVVERETFVEEKIELVIKTRAKQFLGPYVTYKIISNLLFFCYFIHSFIETLLSTLNNTEYYSWYGYGGYIGLTMI